MAYCQYVRGLTFFFFSVSRFISMPLCAPLWSSFPSFHCCGKDDKPTAFKRLVDQLLIDGNNDVVEYEEYVCSCAGSLDDTLQCYGESVLSDLWLGQGCG